MLVDWSLVCTLIRHHYGPLERAAKVVGSDGRHLRRLGNGEVQQPRFDTGVKLLDLAYDHLPPDQWRRIKQEAA